VHLCVLGFCAENTVTMACPDGAYPDSGSVTGDCLSYEECNPGLTCGSLVNCDNFHCDRTGPRIEIPCADGGGTDSGPRLDVAPVDAAVDAGPPDAGPADVVVPLDSSPSD
jgi:hypothetical protein